MEPMLKILVVDNHPVFLKFMEDFLVNEGHQVMTAKGGLEAIDIMKEFGSTLRLYPQQA
jgi:CheY-like chemotaxis protein